MGFGAQDYGATLCETNPRDFFIYQLIYCPDLRAARRYQTIAGWLREPQFPSF